MGKQQGICLKRNIERHQWFFTANVLFWELNTYLMCIMLGDGFNFVSHVSTPSGGNDL